MPVVTFRIPAARATDARCERLLVQGSALFAKLLQSPPERIRAFVEVYEAGRMAVGGQLSADAGAAFFECYVLAGRPQQQRHALLAAFNDLLATTLDIDPAVIRGACIPVAPEDWGIAGRPASAIRSAEIAQRAAQG
ncbi:tautomerase family protein [Marinobacterium sp. YM272]|uniref:tautomerase family protein n=1 Tax=Marinobacterium sp. YM272 TaxID=3421654 RepID=UPI003D7FC7B6